jgi:CHAD domain-containing protein
MAKPKLIVWNAAEDIAENAARELPKAARAYFRQGRALFRKQSSTRTLHRFRIETKRFRYTLELFRPCYGPGLDRRLALLREMQTHLGEINDCAASTELLGKTHARFRAFLKHRMSAKISELHRFWDEIMDAAGQEHWWTDYLSRFARKQVRHEHR